MLMLRWYTLYYFNVILLRSSIKDATAKTDTSSAKAFDSPSYIEEGISTTPASGKKRYGFLRCYQTRRYKL